MRTFVLTHEKLSFQILMYRQTEPDRLDIMAVLQRYGVEHPYFVDMREEKSYDFEGSGRRPRKEWYVETARERIREEFKLAQLWREEETKATKRAYIKSGTYKRRRREELQDSADGVRVEPPDGEGGETGAGQDPAATRATGDNHQSDGE